MGRISYLIAFTALLAACSPLNETPNNLSTLKPAAPIAKPCPETDTNSVCKADTHDLAANFTQAMQGDYQAQRNTAWAFSGASPFVEANLIQSCAWRKVILAMHSDEATLSDAEQLRIECDKLEPKELTDADKLADVIQVAIAAK